MTGGKYRVAWKRKATEKFARLYNVDHWRVLKNTKSLLSLNPYDSANGIADFPSYPFNGYLWLNINNVILIYHVDSKKKLVSIETCYSALTGEVAEIFYGIFPNDNDE